MNALQYLAKHGITARIKDGGDNIGLTPGSLLTDELRQFATTNKPSILRILRMDGPTSGFSAGHHQYRPQHEGPGTELKKLISIFAMPSGGCGCTNHVVTMNHWGVERCRRNVGIIANWLVAESARRNLPTGPVAQWAMQAIINKAINNAERNQKDQRRVGVLGGRR